MDYNSPVDTILDLARTSAVNETQFGDSFELISDFALIRSEAYGPSIAKIESFTSWAKSQGDPKPGDVGVDRVVTTHSGEHWTVQNKGRDEHATISGTALMQLNDVTRRRVPNTTKRFIITSGTGLTGNGAHHNSLDPDPAIILNRHWLHAVTRYPASLAELGAAHAALTGRGVVERPAGDPLTDLWETQKAARDDVVNALRAGNEEVQLVSACGTGKSRIGLAIGEALGARNVIVFVPTISLIEQTKKTWIHQHGAANLNVLAVCSRDDVGRDNPETPEDLACEVAGTEAGVVAFFAKHVASENLTVVFSTYLSAKHVIDAQHTAGSPVPRFDYAFMDEAHHLVGIGNGDTSAERVKRKPDRTETTRLLATHRVYATATPKFVSRDTEDKIRKLGHEPDFLSAHGSPTFGPRAHTFTVGQAIGAGILSNFRVLVVATPVAAHAATVNDSTLIRTDSGQVITTRMAAAIEAVKYAHRDGATRFLSYHSGLAPAQQFKDVVNDTPGLPAAEHLNGTHSSIERARVLDQLQGNEGGLIVTNAQLLTEGYDIPNLHAIIFVDSKTSESNIIQCIGRVLRKAEGKDHGLIIISVAVEVADLDQENLTDEEWEKTASENNSFKDVFHVLSALEAHDSAIGEMFTQFRLTGNTGGGGSQKDGETRLLNGDREITIVAPLLTPTQRDNFTRGMRLVTAKRSGERLDPQDASREGVLRALMDNGFADTVEEAIRKYDELMIEAGS